MNRTFSLVLLIGGVVLLVLGISSAQSLASDISRFFNHSPTDKAIWMLIGGAVMSTVGLIGLLRTTRSHS